MKSHLVLFVAFVGFGLMAGCTQKPVDVHDGLTEEGIAVMDLVRAVADKAGRPEGEELFAEKMDKKKRNEYSNYFFSVNDVKVDGNSATCDITTKENKSGAEANKTWTLVKEGDKWKLKDAPL